MNDTISGFFLIVTFVGVFIIIRYFKKKHEGSAFTKYYLDSKLLISIIAFIFSISAVHMVTRYFIDKLDIKSTCNITMNDNEAIDEAVFNFVKSNGHCTEIIISEKVTDEYGNSQWEPWWRITGITKNKWIEMQRYKNWYFYVNSGLDKPYVITNLQRSN